MKPLLVTILLALVAALAAAASAASGTPLQTTPVSRLPFPERGYVVDLPDGVAVSSRAFRVTENGRPVGERGRRRPGHGRHQLRHGPGDRREREHERRPAERRRWRPRGRSSPIAQPASRSVSSRSMDASACSGAPASGSAELTRLLSRSPGSAFGTHIYDALGGRSRSSTTPGSRPDRSCCSRTAPTSAARASWTRDREGASAARADLHGRAAFGGIRRPPRSSELAAETGGSFAEASSAAELASIYAALGQRLAGEYVVRYRSTAAPKSDVDVKVEIRGVGVATTSYTAPTPSGLAPFHRSLLSRFVLSGLALALLALFVAGLAAFAVLVGLRSRASKVVQRVQEFAGRHAGDGAERRGVLASRGDAPRARRGPRPARAHGAAAGDRPDRAAGQENRAPDARCDGARRVPAGADRAGTRDPRAVDAVRDEGADRTQAQAGSHRVRRPAAAESPGARFGPSRGAELHRRADRSSWRTPTSPRKSELRRVADGRAAGRSRRRGDPSCRRADGEPRPRAGRAAGRVAADGRRQRRRGPRHRGRHAPRAGRPAPARADAHGAGPAGAVDPLGAADCGRAPSGRHSADRDPPDGPEPRSGRSASSSPRC